MPYAVPRRLAVGSLVCALAVGTPAFAAKSPTTGSAGAGDPYYRYYGNGGYDVEHYDIGIDYTPTSGPSVPDTVTGTTTLTATATQSLKRFNLDLVLPASKVKVNGVLATFRQPRTSPTQGHELTVFPATQIAEGDTFTVKVKYAGKPQTIRSLGIKPWIRTDDGGGAAVGEPEIAAWWFPSNDHPRDKATFDVKVTVPEGLEAIGNGDLVSHDTVAGRTTWRWVEDDPMATYLAFFAAGRYTITESDHDGMPMVMAIAEGSGLAGQRAATDIARTPEVVDWAAEKFGPYPFDEIGGVMPASSFGFALENQTRPVYARSIWSVNRANSVSIVVHEMAHQWFGDSVSVANWKHIWLNEGFATFAEWLWAEDHGGPSASSTFAAAYDDPDANWYLHIGDPGAGNEFDDAVYDRGAMTLQALRTLLGDEVFFDVLRTWTSDHEGGNTSITDFRLLAEQKSGRDLRPFFAAWLSTSARPAATEANGFPADFARRGTPSAKVRALRETSEWVRGHETH